MENDIDNLDEKIKSARSKNRPQESDDPTNDNLRLGLRAGTELVAAIGVGGALGYWIDGMLETKPLFFLALLILGVITGFVNVWRTTQGISTAPGIGHQKQLKENEDNGKSN